jgi:hypothetical protein
VTATPIRAAALVRAYGVLNVLAGAAWTVLFADGDNALPGLAILAPMVALVGGLVVFYREGVVGRVLGTFLDDGESTVDGPPPPGPRGPFWPQVAVRTLLLFAVGALAGLAVDAASGGALLSDDDAGGWLLGPLWAGLGLLDLGRAAVAAVLESRRATVTMTARPPYWRRPRNAPTKVHRLHHTAPEA